MEEVGRAILERNPIEPIPYARQEQVRAIVGEVYAANSAEGGVRFLFAGFRIDDRDVPRLGRGQRSLNP